MAAPPAADRARRALLGSGPHASSGRGSATRERLDGAGRLAYAEIHRDEKTQTVVAFVQRALNWVVDHDTTARRVQTDNAWT
jgi:hypothetical protein